jgi:hypothetical protein
MTRVIHVADLNNKHMAICSMSLIIKARQVKTSVQQHSFKVDCFKIKREIMLSIGKDVE